VREFDFEADLKIDPNALDVEWLGQPGLYGKWAKIARMADEEARKAEEAVKTIRSQLLLEVSADPSICKDAEGRPVEKLTDATREAWYRTQAEYREAKRRMHEAQANNSMLQNALRALSQRKDALEYLVQLESRGYFSGPKVPRVLSEEWVRRQRGETVHDKVNQSLNPATTSTRRKPSVS